MTAVTSIVVPQDVPGVGSPRARALWTWAGLVLAALIVAALGVSSVGNLSYQLIPSRHRLFTARLALVNLKVARGDVTVESSSEPRTIVTTSGARGLTSPSDEERVSGDSLVIRSSCGQSSSTTVATATTFFAYHRRYRSTSARERATSPLPESKEKSRCTRVKVTWRSKEARPTSG